MAEILAARAAVGAAALRAGRVAEREDRQQRVGALATRPGGQPGDRGPIGRAAGRYLAAPAEVDVRDSVGRGGAGAREFDVANRAVEAETLEGVVLLGGGGRCDAC